MTDFLFTLSQYIDNARSRSDSAQVEIELRVFASESEFLERFSACSQMPTFGKPRLDESTSIAQSIGSSKVRSEYCVNGCCLWQNTTKTRIRSADFRCAGGRRIRVDMQTETPCSSVVNASSDGAHIRVKQRLSFAFTDLPGWRVDFTRVRANEPMANNTYEIEVECQQLVSDRAPSELAQEVTHVLERLKIL